MPHRTAAIAMPHTKSTASKPRAARRQASSANAASVTRGELSQQLIGELERQYAATLDIAPLLAIADKAAANTEAAIEQAALAMASERIHSSRETYVGLAAINARVLADTPVDGSGLDTKLAWWPQLGRFLALLFAEQDARLDSVAAELLNAVTQHKDCRRHDLACTRLTLARHLLGFADLRSDTGLMVQLDAIAAEALAVPGIDATAAALWWGERAVIGGLDYGRRGKDFNRLEAVLAGAEAHLARHPHADTRFKLLRVRLDIANTAKSRADAEAALAAMPGFIGPNKKVNLVTFLRTRGMFTLEYGASVDAERDLRQALQLAERIAAPAPQRLIVAHLLAAALMGQNLFDEACAVLDAARRYTPAGQIHFVDSLAALARSFALWDSDVEADRSAALEQLRAGLAAYRSSARHLFLRATPHLAALAAARALRHGIEPEFVSEAIRRRELAPPNRRTEAWPWALRLRLFGGFVLERRDAPAASNPRGKAQQKPIAILRALALLGPNGGDRRALARRVWRGVDPDDQADALEMGIGRARKLLGDETLIQVQDGRIFLDARRVFVDTWAFEEIEQAIRAVERDGLGRARIEALGQQLLSLYIGRLFDDDDSLAASAIIIEQFRERFINAVIALAKPLASHDLPAAIDLMQRAIEREPYSERLYRSLIEQLARAGEYAEAMRWFRRCQHAVSQAYGVAISPNTEAVLALIRVPPPNPPVES